jgi:hypothetical protein
MSPRHHRRTLVGLCATAALAAGCTGSGGTNSADGTAPRATAIDVDARSAEPSTTPVPTAYPTMPIVTAVAPYWTPVGWNVEVVQEYLQLVDAALAELGAEHFVDPNAGTATLENGTRVDLTLLAAQLTTVARGEWEATIATYLETTLSPNQASSALTFENAEPMLRVRVGTLTSLGLSLEDAVAQPIIDDLVVVVVVQSASAVSYLQPAQVTSWGRTNDEIITTAISQTLNRPVTTERSGLFMSVRADQYAASRLLDPTRVMGGSPVNGFIVAIPNGDRFYAVTVNGSLSPSTIADFALQVTDDFTNRSNPASPDLYWWRDGLFVSLPILGGSVELPQALREVIAAD